MPGTVGPEARRRLQESMRKAVEAIDLWLNEVACLDELPGQGLYYPDSLEVGTGVLFDRVPIGALLIVLDQREKGTN